MRKKIPLWYCGTVNGKTESRIHRTRKIRKLREKDGIENEKKVWKQREDGRGNDREEGIGNEREQGIENEREEGIEAERRRHRKRERTRHRSGEETA